MSTAPLRELIFFGISNRGTRNNRNPQTIYCASWKMTINPNPEQTNIKKDFSRQHNKIEVPQLDTKSPVNLQFNKLQQLGSEDRIEFGQFVAREVVLDEELWTAAWLRAESRWEDQTNERYVDSYKRKYADQEFHALKRRCKNEMNSSCIVALKKEDKNIKRTVVKSVVGTLDVTIRYLLSGESFPGEKVRAPLFCSINRTEKMKYGYIANVCVAKSARRQGIATNMLSFAVNTAKTKGAEQVFVHVHRNNEHAKDLYQKMGFKIVEEAIPQLSREQTYLLCFVL